MHFQAECTVKASTVIDWVIFEHFTAALVIEMNRIEIPRSGEVGGRVDDSLAPRVPTSQTISPFRRTNCLRSSEGIACEYAHIVTASVKIENLVAKARRSRAAHQIYSSAAGRAENGLDLHAYRCVVAAARNRQNNCVCRPHYDRLSPGAGFERLMRLSSSDTLPPNISANIFAVAASAKHQRA